MSPDIDGRIAGDAGGMGGAFVAGGTRGIGRAIAACLIRDGYRVTVCGSTGASVEDARRWATERGLALRAKHVDVRDAAALTASLEDAEREAGTLRVLIHAAGKPTVGKANDLSLGDWDDCLDLNLRTAFSAAKSSLPSLRRAGGGSIVLVSSIWSVTTTHGRVAYINAKTAMTGLVRALALDHAGEGIRVNAIAPGYVHTDLLRGSLAKAGKDVEDELRRIERMHPLGHMVAPEDVAETAAFLVSARARSITGQTLVVDGGISIRHALGDSQNAL
jgi:NAD(P)-dependent dehydrogenase (short-subunit alcohol dehydrogenase family)